MPGTRSLRAAFLGILAWSGAAVGGVLEHQLFRAIKTRHDDRVVQLMREGTPVNLRAADGTTPLMIAALHGSPESLGLLLEKGADPNLANDAGCTALLWAVADPEKVRLLLSRGANVNARSGAGMTPLLAAASLPTGSTVVELLLTHDAEIEARNNRGRSVLRRAILGGNPDTVRLVLAHAKQRGKLDAVIGDDAADLLALASVPEGNACVSLLCGQLTEWNGGRLPDAGQAVAIALQRQR
ncbi:MAG: hypothetical protein GWO24_13430, partial [Akkermansiaceae bacterium]|nr:hypothetical protein [Akkermansiaceae bacterium]